MAQVTMKIKNGMYWFNGEKPALYMFSSVNPLRLGVSVVKLFSVVILLLLAFPARAQLMAGAARVDITPDVKARSVPLGGYAARLGAPATGVHDPVYARALALSQGGVKMAIVSLDMCFLPASVRTETAKRLAASGAGIDAAHLFLCATHTHSAPDPLAMHSGNTFTNLKGWTPFDAKLLDFTAEKIAQSVAEAEKALSPATIRVVSQNEPGVNRNRRSDPVVDEALTALRVSGMDGKTLATVVNFAAHPTLYDDKMMQISADWTGVMCGDMEAGGANGVCLFLNGAEGDASPNGVDAETKAENKVTAYGHRMSRLVMALLAKRESPPPAAARASLSASSHAAPSVTSRPAGAFVSHSSTSKGLSASAELKMWTQTVTLPPRKPNGMFYLAARQLGASMTQAGELVKALMPTTTQITFARIGDLLLMGFPCEPSGAVGLAAKQMARNAGVKTPAVVALTNDWLAYCLTPEQYKAGKYEAMMSFYGEPFGTVMLEGVKIGLEKR